MKRLLAAVFAFVVFCSFCAGQQKVLKNADIVRMVKSGLGADVILPRHRNPPQGDGGPNHWEIWLRDPDGYTVVLASPDGSAEGNWKP